MELGDSLEWSCRRCPSRRPGQIGAWTRHLLRLRQLRRAGYPLAANDLPLETWLALGELEELIDGLRARRSGEGLKGV